MKLALPRRAARSIAWLVVAALAAGCTGARPSPSLSTDPTLAASANTPSAPPATQSTNEPTTEPSPSSDSTRPPRTTVEINPNPVDRPGVPDAVRDRPWWSASEAGLLGTTARIALPSGEVILHVADGLVVSAVSIAAEEHRQDLFVRELETGVLVRLIETALHGIDARVAGRWLFWAGMSRSEAEQDTTTDGGAWTADLDGGEPVELVEGGTVMGTIFSGRQLLLSPSRETIAAAMGSYGEGAFVDVIDTRARSVDRRLRDIWPWAITDDAFLQWDTQPSDFLAPGSGMSAYDLDDGSLLWRFPDGDDVDRFAPHPVMALGEDFVVEYYWDGLDEPDHRILAVFNPRTGARRELLRQPNDDRSVLVARADLSTATHVILEHADRDGADPWVLSTLEIATGDLSTDAFTIEPPLLCDGEACWYE